MFAHAAKLNWEDIVSKNPDAPHRSERNEGWLKIKTAKRGTFPVLGSVKDPSGVAAPYLGKQEGKELVYMGKVGTGWSGRAPSRARYPSSSTRSSARRRGLASRSRSLRRPGSSRRSPPT